MIEAFVRRPAMTTMLVMVFVVLGIVSRGNLIIESTPRVEFPLVDISAVYYGASPHEIETQLIKKIEDAIAEISQIKRIQSFASENFGRVMIEFETGTNVNIKSIEVKDKVERIVNTLPKNAEKPVVSRFDPLISPILDLVLSSEKHDERALFEYADKKLKDMISVIKGVASVDVYGGKQRQINVRLDPILMKKHFISIKKVTDAVSDKNVNIPGGAIDKKTARSSVRMLGEFKSVADIAGMELVTAEGKTIRLSDIATVEDGHKKVETHTRFNGRNVVGLSVKKLSDGDAVNIVRRFKKAMNGIREALPEGMKLTVAFDSTKYILDDTRTTVKNIFFGILLTIVILFFFLGDWRTTVVAAVVIPTSIISTLFPMDMAGYSINFLTLLAIATALGALIANALVVIESVTLHLEYGKPPVQAAIDGTKEAAVAVFAAAGTNLVVFTPMTFMGGMIGQFFEQFGMTVVYATIFSILASFSLTPMLCALLLKPRKREGVKPRTGIRRIGALPEKTLSLLVSEYKRVFKKIFSHPWLTVAACLLVFFSIRYPLRYVGHELFPASDNDMLMINIEMPQGTLLEKTLNVTMKLERLAAGMPEVTSYLSYVGIDGAENGSVTVNLKEAEKRQRSDLDLINALIPEAAKIPDAEISFSRGQSGPGGADMTINVYGLDYDRMISISGRMKDIMLESGYFRSVESSHKIPKEEIRFIPDDDRMIRFGVKNPDVGNTLRWAVTGDNRNIFKDKGEEYDIRIQYDKPYRESPEDIANVTVMSRHGLVPISSLGEIKRLPGFAPLRRRDKERVIQLAGYLSKGTSGRVQARLDSDFKKIEFPPGYHYKYAGNAEFQAETNRELGKAFVLAVILTYMLLVAILNSFTYPFVIVTSIATAFIGVFYLLFFLGFSMNIGSMMAMIMLVGLVVNNAILMLDYTMKKLAEGKEVTEALWLGASVKFRVILMTSLAVIFGALPQLFDDFAVKASMGGVIIGGMLASILFTFILIPIAFWLVYRAQSFLKKLVT